MILDINGWLRGIDLEQYAQTFRDNEIDEAVLPNLTSEDLRELGVTIVGHRRKLLTAIGELSGSPTAPITIEELPAAAEPQRAGDTAERRLSLRDVLCRSSPLFAPQSIAEPVVKERVG